MNMMTTIGMRRCDVQVEAIRAEFGAVIGARILEAEAMDFLWDARVREHYLGQQVDALFDDDDAVADLSRIAFLSVLDGDWHAGICLVDGEGDAIELVVRRRFGSFGEAEMAFIRTR